MSITSKLSNVCQLRFLNMTHFKPFSTDNYCLMKSKQVIAYLLLIIFSIYFLCPVLCSALRIEDDIISVSKNVSINKLDLLASSFKANLQQLGCCQAKDKKFSSQNNQHEENDNNCCCTNLLELLAQSDSQFFNCRTQETFSSIVCLPSSIAIPSISTSSLLSFQPCQNSHFHSPYHQISIRAPPFSQV